MIKNTIKIIFLTTLSGMLLTACTTIPEQLKGEYSSLTPANTTETDLQSPVRWGGIILETRPEEDFTCFEILARQLETSMRPDNGDQSDGRFIACKPGFYDPEVFKKNREVTVIGKIVHIDGRKVGEFDYQFPVVDIEFMSLWPKRRPRDYYNRGPYYPYYWHYPHYGFGHPYRYRY
jgi:outer membrane lipoprotein